jgi:hypothetical protein
VDSAGNLLGIVTASDFLKLARALLQMTRRFETLGADLTVP